MRKVELRDLLDKGIDGKAEFWGLPKDADFSVRISPADLKRLHPDFGRTDALFRDGVDEPIWSSVEIDFGSIGNVVVDSPNNTPIEANSLKVDAKAFEAADRIVVRSETDRGAKPSLGKRGPKPKYDWKELEKIAFQILDAQGTPTRIDEDLPNQASLIRQVLDKANIEPVPGDSTMRIHAAQWIREFEETRRQIASS